MIGPPARPALEKQAMTFALWLAVGALAAGLVLVAAMLLASMRRIGRDWGARLETTMRDELRQGRLEASAEATRLREEVARQQKDAQDSLVHALTQLGQTQQTRLDSVSSSLRDLETSIRKNIEDLLRTQREEADKLRDRVEARLRQIQEGSERKLDEMRRIVDEKLQSTLEKRLGESFRLVSERLEAVQKGLGEMKQLADGVGDLKRTLTNVKTRGTWGEVRLAEILEQILTPDQYAANVAIKPDSREVVEFAIRLPGRAGDGDTPVWLPVDSKFPHEDYDRLVEASQAGDAEAVRKASDDLARQVRKAAQDIREKYIFPPYSTDFAILFLPTEGLYAEVLRRPGFHEQLQREQRVLVTGPTTFAALLNSLRMGFRTLAIEKRSSEVWRILSAVKTEFLKFGEVLERARKQVDTVRATLGKTAVRNRQMFRKLEGVETLSEAEAQAILQLPENASEEAETVNEDEIDA